MEKFITNFNRLDSRFILFSKSNLIFENNINILNKIAFLYLMLYIYWKKSNENFTKIRNNYTLKACSSVDRASDSDSESQGFDSLHAYNSIFEKTN